MPDETGARSQRATQAILAYLARNPWAADNEQGIAMWWLPSMNVDAPLMEVRQALLELVRMQSLSCTHLPDGSVVYRANPAARP